MQPRAVPEPALLGLPGSFTDETSFQESGAYNWGLPTSAESPCDKSVRSVCLSDELSSVSRRFAGVFMLEIDVHIHALAEPGIEAFPPGRDLLRSVVFEAKSSVSKVGSEHLRGVCLSVSDKQSAVSCWRRTAYVSSVYQDG